MGFTPHIWNDWTVVSPPMLVGRVPDIPPRLIDVTCPDVHDTPPQVQTLVSGRPLEQFHPALPLFTRLNEADRSQSDEFIC